MTHCQPITVNPSRIPATCSSLPRSLCLCILSGLMPVSASVPQQTTQVKAAAEARGRQQGIESAKHTSFLTNKVHDSSDGALDVAEIRRLWQDDDSILVRRLLLLVCPSPRFSRCPLSCDANRTFHRAGSPATTAT